MLIFMDISSMKANRCRCARMKGWRRLIQNARSRAPSARTFSAARSVFVAGPQPKQPVADRRTYNFKAVGLAQLAHQFIQRQTACQRNASRFSAELWGWFLCHVVSPLWQNTKSKERNNSGAGPNPTPKRYGPPEDQEGTPRGASSPQGARKPAGPAERALLATAYSAGRGLRGAEGRRNSGARIG